ncbi:MAG: AfsA-related hotdog domain-containing protein [Leptospiraceae bacterium]|nr:AfsA-related hotdog domain-containing protein [Leptospiraceae bacterium]
MEEIINFVDKNLVHKTKEENVHIYNLRRALHREVDAEVFENQILSQLTKDEEEFLLNYYVKKEGLSGKPAYILRTIPVRISYDIAQSYLTNSNAEPEEIVFLNDLYKLDEEKNEYVLQRKVTEADQNKILSIFNLRNLHISDQEKYELAKIFEKISVLEKKPIFFANLFVDQSHPYFFEHPQEHVPGMLLLEAGRQFLIAGMHVFGSVPREGISFMLTKMDSKFSNYVELNYQIRLRATPIEFKVNKQGFWSYYLGTVTFYQKNKEVTTIEYEASMVPVNLFKRLRTDKDKYDQLPRFRPIPGVENNISLRDSRKRYLSSIVNISIDGFMLKFPNDDFLKEEDGTLNESKEYEFFMFFDRIGFIHGNCSLKWIEPYGDNGIVAGYKMEKLNGIDSENLKEAIKFHFRLIDDREIL